MFAIIRIWTLALLVLAGCTGGEDSGNNPPPQDEDPPPSRLHGMWEFRSVDMEEQKRYLFESGGRFQSIYESTSGTSIHEGTYNVIDSMAHIVFHQGGRPSEEIWLRFFIREDSMWMCKGVSLSGESETLVGDWKTIATVPDSSGNYPVYGFVFSEDGLLQRTSPGFVDTSRYLADGAVIQVQDENTGKVEMNLRYEIMDGRLSVYNPETGRWLYRVR